MVISETHRCDDEQPLEVRYHHVLEVRVLLDIFCSARVPPQPVCALPQGRAAPQHCASPGRLLRVPAGALGRVGAGAMCVRDAAR